jgi:hypothetical protein
MAIAAPATDILRMKFLLVLTVIGFHKYTENQQETPGLIMSNKFIA